MRDRTGTRSTVIAATSLLVVGFGAAAAAQSISVAVPAASAETMRHAAKIVCGVQPDPNSMQLVRGAYATVVNLLNIGDVAADISGVLALAHPPVPPVPGPTFFLPGIALQPGEAAAVDCEDIRATVFPFGMPASYIDGFVILESTGSILVSAVYTAAPLVDKSCCKSVPGPVASIDVEPVAPMEPAPGSAAQPDLVSEPLAPESDPPGAPGTGFCSVPVPATPPDVVAQIRNIGIADAAASTAEVDFGRFGTVSAAVGQLSPGQSQQITVPIPVRCFGTGAAASCEFDVRADATGQVGESLETNNSRHGQCRRAQRG